MSSWLVKKVVSDKISKINPFEDEKKGGYFSNSYQNEEKKESSGGFWEERERRKLEEKARQRHEKGEKNRDKYRKKYNLKGGHQEIEMKSLVGQDKKNYSSPSTPAKKSCCTIV
eukprot:TRINITY_DN14790_c0_g1_i1.p1 TRINITY_DN14790_c0_g1~~TRINITY_DN14790_c0_g1_i1.p1  ORF type:complete len:128 (+),score=21.16 TRINITY_DN14790_c0_g1_i1:45-386(+)